MRVTNISEYEIKNKQNIDRFSQNIRLQAVKDNDLKDFKEKKIKSPDKGNIIDYKV